MAPQNLPNMAIDFSEKVIAAKAELKATTLAALKKFQEDTGMFVTALDVSIITQNTCEGVTGSVVTDISVETAFRDISLSV